MSPFLLFDPHVPPLPAAASRAPPPPPMFAATPCALRGPPCASWTRLICRTPRCLSRFAQLQALVSLSVVPFCDCRWCRYEEAVALKKVDKGVQQLQVSGGLGGGEKKTLQPQQHHQQNLPPPVKSSAPSTSRQPSKPSAPPSASGALTARDSTSASARGSVGNTAAVPASSSSSSKPRGDALRNASATAAPSVAPETKRAKLRPHSAGRAPPACCITLPDDCCLWSSYVSFSFYFCRIVCTIPAVGTRSPASADSTRCFNDMVQHVVDACAQAAAAKKDGCPVFHLASGSAQRVLNAGDS